MSSFRRDDGLTVIPNVSCLLKLRNATAISRIVDSKSLGVPNSEQNAGRVALDKSDLVVNVRPTSGRVAHFSACYENVGAPAALESIRD